MDKRLQDQSISLVNGAPKTEISVHDRGLSYGDGLFETIAFCQGDFELLSLHLKRLLNSAQRLSIPLDRSNVESDLALLQSLLVGQKITEAVVKYTVTRGIGERGYQIPESTSPNRIVTVADFPRWPGIYYKEGVEVGISQIQLCTSHCLAGIKHLNRLEQVLARTQCIEDGFVEALLRDTQGNIIEGTFSNIFLVKQRRLYTPLLDHCGVKGIVRQFILDELSKQLALPAYETAISTDMILAAEEVFLCNSLIGVWPINKILQQRFAVGPVTLSIQQSLSQSMAARC